MPVALYAQPADTVRIQVDLTKEVGPMRPVWAWFGYDEPNYTYMKDGRKLLSEIAALSPVTVQVRAHNLLTTGDGEAALKWGSTNAYTEDKRGRPVYDWTLVDSIFDTYLERGMRPFAQIGFMPEALSTKPQPYRHHFTPDQKYGTIFTGWAYPPKSYKKWAKLVHAWVQHCMERYGEEEVLQWYWELWNEPNIDYWMGTTEEYIKLYDYTADAVKRALPNARIGGPEVTGPGWDKSADFLRTFLEHCARGKNYATGETGAPLDFITFHAKGAPKIVEDASGKGYVQMNLGQQLRDIDKGFEIVASFPEWKDLPIIIGESDPEGCAACSVEFNPQNAYRNGTMYSSYTAAAFARKYALADHYGVNFEGAVTWAFEFENQPWFAGFRDLATNGVDKPVLNVFRMYGLMAGQRVQVGGDLAYDAMAVRDSSIREADDINALAAKDERTATVMVWNYHDDNLPAPDAPVTVEITGLPGGNLLMEHYRIDQEHSNAYTLWQAMGSPQNPAPEQITELEAAGQLTLLTSPEWVKAKDGKVSVKMQLPRQGVSLLRFSWK